MRPQPCSFIGTQAWRVQLKVPNRCTPTTRENSSGPSSFAARGLPLASCSSVISSESSRGTRPSRLGSEYGRTIDFASSEHRVAALERALDLVTVAFQARVSEDPACSKPVTAPDLVRLSCNQMSVVASAAPDVGGPDSVTFEATP